MSKKLKKQKVAPVWVLTITHGVDDYKSRGCSATSDVWLFDSREKADTHFHEYLLGRLLDAINGEADGGYGNEEVDEKDRFFSCDLELSLVERYFLWVGDGWVPHPDRKPLDDEDLGVIYNEVSSAEYIPCKWTYEIVEMAIN